MLLRADTTKLTITTTTRLLLLNGLRAASGFVLLLAMQPYGTRTHYTPRSDTWPAEQLTKDPRD